jgi:hypothetical protein
MDSCDDLSVPLSDYCCLPLQAPLVYVNQPKALAAKEGYHYQRLCEQNGYRKVGWKGEHNNSREMRREVDA